MKKKLWSFLAPAGLAFLCALNYCIFVFPNRFAPAGIDGICTMIQDLLHINMGYLSLLINLPLLVAAFTVLNREFAVKSAVFAISFSLSMILLDSLDLSPFLYTTETGTSTVLSPIAAGTIRGLLYAATLKLNGSGGGIDIISALIKHKKPHLDIMNILFGINIFIALCSYLVYGNSVEPVICSILYSFITSTVCSRLRTAENETVQYEIFTMDSEALCADIISTLHQRATIIDANGITGCRTKVILCVVKKEVSPFVEELVLKYPGCTVFKSIVNNSMAGLAYK